MASVRPSSPSYSCAVYNPPIAISGKGLTWEALKYSLEELNKDLTSVEAEEEDQGEIDAFVGKLQKWLTENDAADGDLLERALTWKKELEELDERVDCQIPSIVISQK